jgi:hypothetical protein
MIDRLNEITEGTKFIRININTEDLADYATGDYDDSDYLTENTP